MVLLMVLLMEDLNGVGHGVDLFLELKVNGLVLVLLVVVLVLMGILVLIVLILLLHLLVVVLSRIMLLLQPHLTSIPLLFLLQPQQLPLSNTLANPLTLKLLSSLSLLL